MKMQTVPQLFDEFAAALQFPWYFGENWAASDECLTDLAWLPPEAGYVLVLRQPLDVLRYADADLPVLVHLLTKAISEWAAPAVQGEWWDRPAVPFHVILQSDVNEAADVESRWLGAGAKLRRLNS